MICGGRSRQESPPLSSEVRRAATTLKVVEEVQEITSHILCDAFGVGGH